MSANLEAFELSAASPMWPALFDMERVRLAAIFGADATAIEHIGSTAVPGLGAKPVIDVLLGAPSLEAVERHIPELEAEGYRYVPELEMAVPSRRYFVKTDGHPGNFVLHGVVMGTPYWRDHLAFRDALRNDPALVEQYWKVKRRLTARNPNDRAAYADGKATFIKEVLDKIR
jgi:GrpB-like predicted nucleotidyltransferase (UPF0157 family)